MTKVITPEPGSQMTMGSITFSPQPVDYAAPFLLIQQAQDARDAARYRAIRDEVLKLNNREPTLEYVGELCDWADAKTQEKFDIEADKAVAAMAAIDRTGVSK